MGRHGNPVKNSGSLVHNQVSLTLTGTYQYGYLLTVPERDKDSTQSYYERDRSLYSIVGTYSVHMYFVAFSTSIFMKAHLSFLRCRWFHIDRDVF
jgi:hypothetical protein